jgi:uncharacterized membrane protein YesL
VAAGVPSGPVEVDEPEPVTGAQARRATRPSIPGAIRASAVDVFYNSWRLVPANLVWGAGFVAIALVGLSAPVLGLLLVPLLAFPTVGLFRLGALIARGEGVSLSDAFAAWRQYFPPTLAAGVAITVGVVVAGWDMAAGIMSDALIGWILGTLAAWGLLLVLAVSLAFWPLLVDPARAERPVRERVKLAGLLVVAYPLRVAALLAVIVVILVASFVAFAALITISVAFVALVASRWVLPAADRLEARMAARDQAGSSASMR